MTPENILGKLIDQAELNKFMMGFGWKKMQQKKERGLMIRDYCDWREKQEPFVDDKEFFKQAYGIDVCQFTMDLIKEIYLIRKELDEICNDTE